MQVQLEETSDPNNKMNWVEKLESVANYPSVFNNYRLPAGASKILFISTVDEGQRHIIWSK